MTLHFSVDKPSPQSAQIKCNSSLPPPYTPQPLFPLAENDIAPHDLATFRALDGQSRQIFNQALCDFQRSVDPDQWGLYRHGQLLTPVEPKQGHGMIECLRWVLEMIAPPEESLRINETDLGTSTRLAGMPFAL